MSKPMADEPNGFTAFNAGQEFVLTGRLALFDVLNIDAYRFKRMQEGIAQERADLADVVRAYQTV